MYITPEVDLPTPLVDAADEGRLVIFAGAGVSMGDPSNLPNFKDLARHVGEMAIGPPGDQPVDQYLGRAAEKGVDVQNLTRLALDLPGSGPTPLHTAIVSLFGSVDRVKIVTTNFDRHFGATLRDRFGAKCPPIYCGPALPLGREPSGLVHLHGALEAPQHGLVLTDSDFGRAYLADGWATRFLLELFSKHVICFVGYSHDDVVMRYLARSLGPSTATRYAFTPDPEVTKWRTLGIEAIAYPLRSPPNEHAALGDALTAWSRMAEMGALGHEHRLRALLVGEPPIDVHDRDYLLRALASPTRRQTFLREARGPGWFRFVQESGVLDDLFLDQPGHTEPGDHVARRAYGDWLADEFLLQHPEAVVELLRNHQLRIGPALWSAMANRLARVDVLPSPVVVAKWVSILVTTPVTEADSWGIEQLLERLGPDAMDAALLLLRWLIAPTVATAPVWFDENATPGIPQLRLSVNLRGDPDAVAAAWRAAIKPNLSKCAHSAALLAAETLTRSFELLQASGDAAEGWDPMSYGRSAIEPHAQDSFSSATDVVIDIARDCLDCLLAEDRPSAQALIAGWRVSRVPLLRRLAIYGLTKNDERDSASSLVELLNSGWLFDPQLKHETFALLASDFSRVDEEARSRFLDSALTLPVFGETPADASAARSQEYSRYNLLVWLAKSVPDSDVTSARLRAVADANPDFSPREHPDLNGWTSGVQAVVPISPFTVQELLSTDAGSAAETLLTWEGEAHAGRGPDRLGLLQAVSDAASTSFEWSWGIAGELESRTVGNAPGVWQALFRAWERTELSAEQWDQVLGLVERLTSTDSAGFLDSSRLLEKAAAEASLSNDLHREQVRRIASALVLRGDSLDGLEAGQPADWLGMAINHPAGRAALAWLQVLRGQRAEAGEAWTGLPFTEREALERIVAARNTGAERARTVLLSQFSFVHALDSDWTTRVLLPLFDWDRDSYQAAQAWDGFLQWGRPGDQVFQLMRPYLEQTYAHTATELLARRRVLASKLAVTAVYGSAAPWGEGGWLREFCSSADSELRAEWAARVGAELRVLPAPAVKLVWDRWLSVYWDDRIHGRPAPLDSAEGSAMIEWALGLGPVLGEAVARIERTPYSPDERSGLLRHIVPDDLAGWDVSALARVFHALLTRHDRIANWDRSCAENAVERLISAGAEPSQTRQLCEQLARLGSPRAIELAARAE